MTTEGEFDLYPALKTELRLPNAVEVLGSIHTSLVVALRVDAPPSVDFPSPWRLAKHVVYERGPLLTYRSRMKSEVP